MKVRRSKTIKQQDRYYGFDTVEHLQTSLLCGNFSSVKEMFAEFSKAERKEAICKMDNEECKQFYFKLI